MLVESSFLLFSTDADVSIAIIALSAFVVALTLLLMIAEIMEWGSLGYSKFATGGTKSCNLFVPTRVGMFVLYFPAAIAFPTAIAAFGLCLDSWSYGGFTNTPRHWTAAVLFTFLFSKRVLESLFLSKFSGKMEAPSMVFISVSYFTVGVACVLICGGDLAFLPQEQNGFSVLLIIGIVISLIGAAGNFYHHYLLANLRGTGEEKVYKVPHGGIFWLTPCPHYFFEVVGWLGFALAIGHIGAVLLLVLGSGSYLFGRTVSTLRWYRDKANAGTFSEPLPSAWKCFPFVDWTNNKVAPEI